MQCCKINKLLRVNTCSKSCTSCQNLECMHDTELNHVDNVTIISATSLFYNKDVYTLARTVSTYVHSLHQLSLCSHRST